MLDNFQAFNLLDGANLSEDDRTSCMQCVVSDSRMHEAKKCPPTKCQQVNYVEDQDHKNSDGSEEENIVFMREEVSEHKFCITEIATSAVIDRTCTKTVAGKSFFINECKKLDNLLLNEIEIPPSTTSLKFLDGSKILSFQKSCMSDFTSIMQKIMWHCEAQYSIVTK